MSMGSLDRHAIAHPRQSVRCRSPSADVGSPAGGHSTVNSLSPTQSKFKDGLRCSRMANSCGFGRDQSLEIDDVEQGCLQYLALDNWAAYSYQRLVGENQR